MDLTNVNNLFINGHRFVAGDLVGKKVKIVKNWDISQNGVLFDGSYYYNNLGGAVTISPGTLGYVIGMTYGNCYYIFNASSKYSPGTWISKDYVEIID
ncbi:hypothetical protein F5ESL0236_04665 [Lactobacillus sp. ESL0236]|uniref:hypothetical protein n=1 Tax=unclassified Lactobacillus TaxID=2620435 RepID=UPI000EFDA5D6|nr:MULTISPECIES: hypothetical protein [unclassified Lactobacillus]RMC39552.1 hypothetical protein F5ESL0237_04655 [Lactobacillus sp. ESL0237]RMC43616.1 hypothetical protein F5ESL0234_04660 [Lactobacillus sp. ESL0234]RMC45098.1 hypothetical protein F5ESL0236_04665 [Lactobacillus sp. ESL0236]